MGSALRKLAIMVSGCRDDIDGLSAKKHLVATFVKTHEGKPEGDTLQVLCILHKKKCINVVPSRALKVFQWKRSTAGGDQDAKDSSNVRAHRAGSNPSRLQRPSSRSSRYD